MLTLGLGTAHAINELGDIAWNSWIATLWSWPLGIVNMQVGAAQDLNELDILVGAAVAPANQDFGLQTGAGGVSRRVGRWSLTPSAVWPTSSGLSHRGVCRTAR